MQEERARAADRLGRLCGAVIEKLAALGGEPWPFAYMENAVSQAMAHGDLEELHRLWGDLREWVEVLTPPQRQDIEKMLRERFGVELDQGDLLRP